jgi:hypothetical protein
MTSSVWVCFDFLDAKFWTFVALPFELSNSIVMKIIESLENSSMHTGACKLSSGFNFTVLNPA